MLLKTDINLLKNLGSIFCIGCFYSSISFADVIDCTDSKNPSSKTVCSSKFKEQRDALEIATLTTNLITDAPIQLVKDTHSLWFNRLNLCKSFDCYKQQFELRLEELNFYTSMNQSLTQHYLKYENGEISKQPIYLQIHQLTKDNIKVEGVAYRNPNNRLESQTIPFLAYSTTEKKSEIVDNENDCKYTFSYHKAYLSVKSMQKNCDRFTGIYRLYD
jgi:uncharacterized protein